MKSIPYANTSIYLKAAECVIMPLKQGIHLLVLSDVPVTKTGIVDDTSVISSGPTVGDDSTFEMAKKVLIEYNIWDKAPKTVKRVSAGQYREKRK